MKNSLKILALSSLLSLNALGSQVPSNLESQEKAHSTRKRPRSPQQEQEPGSPDFDDRPVTSSFISSFAADEGPEAANSAAASGNDLQQPGLLSPRPFRAPNPCLNPESGPQAAERWLYHTPPPECFQPARSAGTRKNGHGSPTNANDDPATNSFVQSFLVDDLQEPACSSTALPETAAAASNSYTFMAQTDSQNAGSYDSMTSQPEIASAATTESSVPANLPSTTINNANCGYPNCPLSKFTTKEMALIYPAAYFTQFLNVDICPNIALHKINGESLGFVLLSKTYSKTGAGIVARLFDTHGPKLFECLDKKGKTALHKLVSSTSQSRVVNMLYHKLDNYDAQDQQGHTPLYDALEYLKNNNGTIKKDSKGYVYDKIKILLSRGATIDNQILELAEIITSSNNRNHTRALLHKELQLRNLASGNQGVPPPAAASSSSASVMIAPQQSGPTTQAQSQEWKTASINRNDEIIHNTKIETP